MGSGDSILDISWKFINYRILSPAKDYGLMGSNMSSGYREAFLWAFLPNNGLVVTKRTSITLLRDVWYQD